MRRFALVMVLSLVFSGTSWGQEPEKQPAVPPEAAPSRLPLAPTGAEPPADVDITPGDQAPDFQLDSSAGGTVRLADLKGHWSVLLFDESRTALVPLRTVQDSLRALGAQPYGVCRDGVGALRTFAQREKLGFPLLSDATGEISQLFTMYDDDNQAIQSGMVIVDPQGVVRLVLQAPSLHVDEVLQMAKHVLKGV